MDGAMRVYPLGPPQSLQAAVPGNQILRWMLDCKYMQIFTNSVMLGKPLGIARVCPATKGSSWAGN